MVDKAMNVLVVDDYATMTKIIKNLLTQIGFNNVEVANSGEQAMQIIARKDFGLIISDWNMEPMTGLELLKKVRADARTAKIPFIMITAENKTENVIEAKKAGVSNYIVKPFNANVLKEKIAAVLGQF